jgi:16S rRNA (adenine1518-N6/adenine1519-N6)-dimethyltransferase
MIQPLINPEVLQNLLASHKLKASKSLGQNFLICEEVLDAVLMGLEGGSKNVTELGSGLGTLTQGLIASGYQVRGIEKDDDFVKILPTIVPPKMRKNLTVIHDDLLDVSWEWEGRWQLVGNIPYNISGLIIRLLTKIQTVPSSAILLMQKEVADRIVHSDGSMSLLGLSTGLWGSAELLLQVPPSCFIPAPAVHSSVIQIRPFSTMLPLEKREEIIAKAKPFFQAKRKQIAHTLKVAYNKNSDEVELITKQLNISPSARPENLSVQEWTTLCDIL